MTKPFWLQDSIFYQIFPDRFANGDPDNDPPNVHKWGAPPTSWGFQGGDLRGIVQHFDYLLDMGINALYLNPIFSATSPHRYNTSDYFQIDPKLGTRKDFQALVTIAHNNNVRIILDGVFNHTGRGFFAFNDILENGEHSGFKDWYHVKSFPLDAYGHGEPQNYLGWWNHHSLPKLNTRNPAVRKYIFSVARYWLDQGIDGWRLDVPNEINDESFWVEFRREVKNTNRDACLIGEIWDINPHWVDESHFDGLMNYPLRNALVNLLQEKGGIDQFDFQIRALLESYSHDELFAMYNPLGSHDTERIMTVLGGNFEKMKLAFLILMTLPGAPAIYYGDEIGLEGGKDPDNRRAFPWKEVCWNQELRTWIKSLVALRRKSVCLRRGDFIHLYTGDGIYAYGRRIGEDKIMVILNVSGQSRNVAFPCNSLGYADGQSIHTLIEWQNHVVHGGQVSVFLPAWSGSLLG